jgi:hypothetical protein
MKEAALDRTFRRDGRDRRLVFVDHGRRRCRVGRGHRRAGRGRSVEQPRDGREPCARVRAAHLERDLAEERAEKTQRHRVREAHLGDDLEQRALHAAADEGCPGLGPAEGLRRVVEQPAPASRTLGILREQLRAHPTRLVVSHDPSLARSFAAGETTVLPSSPRREVTG